MCIYKKEMLTIMLFDLTAELACVTFCTNEWDDLFIWSLVIPRLSVRIFGSQMREMYIINANFCFSMVPEKVNVYEETLTSDHVH